MRGSDAGRPDVVADEKILVRASRAAAAWAGFYALYRCYYAVGGTVGMFGTPVSEAQWRLVNAVGGTIIAVLAFLPLALLGSWRHARRRPALLALCWVVAVGGVAHALTGMTQRVVSLAGIRAVTFPPFWRTIDRRVSDLQALFFNEPWFLVTGLLWATIAWGGALATSPRRRAWIASALAATAVLTALGLLSAFGAIGRRIVG